MTGEGKYALRSRHQLCQQTLTWEHLALDASGVEFGRAEITAHVAETVSNNLTPTLQFEFYVHFTSGTPRQLLISPVVTCDNRSCTVPVATSVIASNGVWTTRLTVPTQTQMGGATQALVNQYVEFVIATSGDSLSSGRSRIAYPSLASIPDIRCDVGMAKASTQGCVFVDAAAVFTLSASDSAVNESALHIRDALSAGMPGKLKRSAINPVLPDEFSNTFRPLSRLRNKPKRDANRSASKAKCLEIYKTAPVGACTSTGDSDEEPTACDCDEYPFASTNQGASTGVPVLFSVRKIDSSDNRTAGARLGAFYSSERVIDDENFYVEIKD